MNKLGLIPIISVVIVAILAIGGVVSQGGFFSNQDPAMTISNINLSSEKYPPSIASLTITADALFHEDIESISMKGKVYMSDGSYKSVNFDGNPNNGVKNQMYELKYSDGGLYLNQKDLDNMDYIELTITTVNKEGASKEINLDITSDGQIKTNQDINNLILQNQTNSSNSNDSKDDKNPNSENSNSGTDGSNNHNGMTASQAKSIIKGSVSEQEVSVGTPHWDSSINMWVAKIYDKNGNVIDAIGVDSNKRIMRV